MIIHFKGEDIDLSLLSKEELLALRARVEKASGETNLQLKEAQRRRKEERVLADPQWHASALRAKHHYGTLVSDIQLALTNLRAKNRAETEEEHGQFLSVFYRVVRDNYPTIFAEVIETIRDEDW